jgi:hypothetical protein
MSTFDIKISKDEWYSIFASIALFIAGYIFAITICESTMFARFGSLIVCIGVIFSVKGLPQLMDAVQPIYEHQAQLLRDGIKAACDGHEFEEYIRAEMSKAVEPKITELEQKMSRTIYSVKNRLLRIEGAIVIIGTLVWGFGDYIVPCIGYFCQK